MVKYMHAAVMNETANSGCLLAFRVMGNLHTCTLIRTPVSFCFPPIPGHSLQPLPKRNVQALNPTEAHTCLAGSSLSWLLESVGIHPYHGVKHVL